MTSNDNDLEDRLTDTQAQLETLQAAAADAEARAATAGEELRALREEHSLLVAQLAEAEAARDAWQADLEQTRGELEQARSRLREAAVRYREVRLASSPDIPHELVPELQTLEEIDREFDSAERIVGRLREKVEREQRQQAQAVRVPLGAPVRKAADVSGLPAAEKIKLGLRQASEREMR